MSCLLTVIFIGLTAVRRAAAAEGQPTFVPFCPPLIPAAAAVYALPKSPCIEVQLLIPDDRPMLQPETTPAEDDGTQAALNQQAWEDAHPAAVEVFRYTLSGSVGFGTSLQEGSFSVSRRTVFIPLISLGSVEGEAMQVIIRPHRWKAFPYAGEWTLTIPRGGLREAARRRYVFPLRRVHLVVQPVLVVDQTGHPVAGASLEASGVNANQGSVYSSSDCADEAGRTSLLLWDDCTYLLRLGNMLAGVQPSDQPLEWSAAPVAVPNFRMVLKTVHCVVHGTLKAQTPEEAKALAQSPPTVLIEALDVSCPADRVNCTENGFFLNDYAPGRYRVTLCGVGPAGLWGVAGDAEFTLTAAEVAAAAKADGQPLQVAVAVRAIPGAAVQVQIFDAQSGLTLPAGGAAVCLHAVSNGNTAGAQWTDDAGEASFTDLPAGDYSLTFSGQGYMDSTQRVHLAAGADCRLAVQFQPLPRLTVLVHDTAGRPAKVVIQAEWPNHDPRDNVDEVVATDADGLAQLAAPVGVAGTVAVQRVGYPDFVQKLVLTGSQSIVLVPPDIPAVNGRILGSLEPGDSMVLVPTDPPGAMIFDLCDGDGRFELHPLPGRYKAQLWRGRERLHDLGAVTIPAHGPMPALEWTLPATVPAAVDVKVE
ncbi:MAG: MSCRAMM family protein [Planctomycetota bacterium]